MDFAVDVAFVIELRMHIVVDRLAKNPAKPCPPCALYFFGPHCAVPVFARATLSIIEAGLVRGAARPIHNVDHSRMQFVQRLG